MTSTAERATLQDATGQAAPSDARKVRILTAVAAQYRELVEPMQSRAGVAGTGDLLPITPHERHCAIVAKADSDWRCNHTGPCECYRRCTCAYRTVREFEHLLAVMRDDRTHPLVAVTVNGRLEKHSVRALRWHLVAYYVDAVRITRHYPKPVKRGQRLAPAKDERILRDKTGAWVASYAKPDWHRTPGARQVLADAGIRWVAEQWPGWEPRLPADVGVKVAA